MQTNVMGKFVAEHVKVPGVAPNVMGKFVAELVKVPGVAQVRSGTCEVPGVAHVRSGTCESSGRCALNEETSHNFCYELVSNAGERAITWQ